MMRSTNRLTYLLTYCSSVRHSVRRIVQQVVDRFYEVRDTSKTPRRLSREENQSLVINTNFATKQINLLLFPYDKSRDRQTFVTSTNDCPISQRLTVGFNSKLANKYIYRVSKNCFCHNFAKFPPTLIIFGTKMADSPKLTGKPIGL